MSLTYRQLKEIIESMADDDLDSPAIVYNTTDEECFEIAALDEAVEIEQLDDGYPVLFI